MATARRAGHGHRPPPVARGLVERPRVLKEFGQAQDFSVICLQAPGGYGKTTVLAQWAERDARPVVWLSVRPAAADAHWLTQALFDALLDEGLVTDHAALPATTGSVSWHLNTLPIVEDLLASVAEPFVVVVDDSGTMAGPPWESLVESLASSLPAGSTLAMSTRDALPTTLWRLQSQGSVRILGPDVLRFSVDEAQQLMTNLGVSIAPGQVERMLDQTEGWPVALYLMGLASGSRSYGAPDTAAGLNEYLRADIVGRLAPDDARFLERVSVLSSLDGVGCDAVTGTQGSLERLRRLASENHLLAPEDASGERYRMHPLLARFLSDDLHACEPDRWRAAHRAASVVEEQRGDLDTAVHHAKLADDLPRLSALVWPHTGQLFGYGRWAVVERWLDGVDEDGLREHCGLALSAAWTALQSGDLQRSNRLSLQASQCAADGDSTWQPDADLLEATIGARGLDHIESSTRSFIRSRPRDDPWQSLAHFLLGGSLVLSDRFDEGVEAFQEGHRLAEALDVPIVRAHCLAGLAEAALAQEDEHKALSHIREVRRLASTYGMDGIVTTAPLFTTSAMGYVLERRYEDARREAMRALRLTALMRGVAPWYAVQGRLSLARVNLALGDPERARLLLDEAGDARGPATASPALDRMYENTLEQLSHVSSGLEGTSSLTTAEVRVLQYLPTHLSFPQIADELVVSRHTVKTQAMSAYRKLGAHSRTQAIDRAREAGLLPHG